MEQTFPEELVVLIVEDEAVLRITLVDSLTDCGFHPLEACDAHEAIRVLETGQHIDVVLTDVQMPGTIDGFGLARWIHANRPGLPVFVASGYYGKSDVANELCAGEPFFVKPYDVGKVAEHMKKAVSTRIAKSK